MNYISIDPDSHKDIIVTFRQDSFVESFGHADDFDVSEYLQWLEQKIKVQPGGFLLIEENNEWIGQMELTIKNYKGSVVGYINLYSLTEPYRGKGYAPELHNYAKKYFRDKGLKEYHLRVAALNTRAKKFYEKMGMVYLKEEYHGKVIRMRGNL